MNTAVLMTLVLFSQPVEIQLHYISPGLKCSAPDGTEARCYDLAGYKMLLFVDNDLWLTKQELDTERKKMAAQEKISDRQAEIIQTLTSDKNILKERVDRGDLDLYSCLERQNGFPWQGVIWGTAVGTLVGIVAGVATWAILSLY